MQIFTSQANCKMFFRLVYDWDVHVVFFINASNQLNSFFSDFKVGRCSTTSWFGTQSM